MDERRTAARIKLVEEHVRAESEHELDGTMATLNETPTRSLSALSSERSASRQTRGGKQDALEPASGT
jgi:hypothetical protein